jgi:hypothetical protein
MPVKRLLLIVPLLIFLETCSKPDDQVIRAQIMGMKTDAEAANWDGVLSRISKHYKDKDGNNYFIISQMIRNYTAGVGELQVNIDISGVSIYDKEAKAQIKLVAKGKKMGKVEYVVGTDEVPEYPTLWFAKERGNWRLIRVEGIKGNNEENPW